MTARDDNPELHRIVVERHPWNAEENDPGELGSVASVRFVCDGGPDAPCHHFPACDCEEWWSNHYVTNENGEVVEPRRPMPGHEDVQQESCWIDPWFNATTGSPLDWIELYDGPDEIGFDDLYSGPVSVSFEGDYMTWEYA